MPRSLADYDLVSESIQGSNIGILKRVQRTSEEKRRIVEATLVPGASIARVARVLHGLSNRDLSFFP
jgi:hypothetical protein